MPCDVGNDGEDSTLFCCPAHDVENIRSSALNTSCNMFNDVLKLVASTTLAGHSSLSLVEKLT